MPEHHIRRVRLHEGLKELRAQSEEIVSVSPDADDPDCYLVITKPAGVETRAS